MNKKLQELKNTIKKTTFKAGEAAYLISMDFLKEYEDCARKNIPIFELDNSSLFKKELFKPNLVEGRDYVAVSQETWEELQFEFDVKREARVKVLENGRPELYPLNISVSYMKQNRTMIISKSADISTLILRIVMEFCIPQEIYFELYTPGSSEPVPSEGTVMECLKGSYRVEVRIIERQKKEVKQLRGIKPLFQTQVPEKAKEEAKPKIEKPKSKPCGLNNLGNTCYMNASLQCLASVPQFVKKLNEIETQEKVTHAVKQLITTMCNRVNASIDTAAFKAAIDEALPQFRGYEQQDAQEFTLALIDKMCEEVPDFVPLFFGTMKSSTTCAECKKVSNSDEKYSCLSLPVAGAKRVIFVPWSNGEQMIRLFAPPSDKKTILVADQNKHFIPVQWPASEFDDVYALEVPELKPNKCVALIRLRTTGDRVLASPLLAEVPVNEKIAETRLKGFVSSRISDLWKKEFRPQITPNWRIVCGPERFSKPKDGSVLCSEELVVEVRPMFVKPEKGYTDIRTRPIFTTPSLNDLIGSFLECTRLDQDNVWKCSCGASTRAIRQSQITSSPPVLILQLKRFSVGKKHVDRDVTPVEISTEIQLDNKKYILRSISNHAGGTGAGHYTALAQRNGFVFSFNDSKVSVAQGFPKESYGAYVLYYSIVE